MGLFKKHDDKAAKSELDALQTELEALRARLEASDVAKAALEARLAALDATTQQLAARPAVTPTDPVVLARIETLSSQVASLDKASTQAATQPGASELAQIAERLAANDTAIRANAEQLALVEQRINSISVELTNQLTELGNDIDALNSGAPASGNEPASLSAVSDEVLDALRTAQVRLASEQARYEIAFREDLAALAEQIRRSARG